jgi:2-dehydropantoate 2-reductase
LVTADVDELPSLDACLVCVKSYDLEDLAQRLNPLVSDTTEVVPVLNGIDIRDRIRKKLLGATIYPACVFIGTHIEEPGVISQDGGACRILFGKASPETGRDASVMAEVFDKSLIKSEWHDDIVPSLWTKYIFIAPFSLVTACYDKTLGQVMESEELSSLVRALMNEVLALAAAQHIPLPVSIIEDSYRKGKDFPSGTKTSFQRDYEVPDRPDERDLFGGAIIRLGKRLDIATPCASGVYETINRTKKPVTRRPQAPAGKSEPI